MNHTSDALPSRIGTGWPGRWIVTWEPGIDRLAALAALKRIARARMPGNPDKSDRAAVFLHLYKSPDSNDITPVESEKTMDELISSEIDEPARNKLKLAILVLKDSRDTRWKSAGIPFTPLILAGAAESGNHEVEIRECELNGSPVRFRIRPDVIAVSLVEDLFLPTREILADLAVRYSTRIVAGGPMTILAPEAVAVHLPGIDFILRGEAERSFESLLRILAAGPFEDRPDDLSVRSILNLDGCLYLGESIIVSTGFDRNPPAPDTGKIPLSFSGLDPFRARGGMELSTCRGCPRSCFFCAHVHGRIPRTIPLETIRRHLERFRQFLDRHYPRGGIPAVAETVNLNDDDILRDPERCMHIFGLIRSLGFRIWGVQTSLESLAGADRRSRLLPVLADPEFYPGGRPVIWIGTDAFTGDRLRRMGKSGSPEEIEAISLDLHRNGILGCHYWIVTDAESDWEELLREMETIVRIGGRCPGTFRIMPNAASLIPYPSTPIYRKRLEQGMGNRIRVRRMLSVDGFPEFDYPLIRFEFPESPFLHALVEPRAAVPERFLFEPWAFLKDLQNSRFLQALQRILHGMQTEANSVRGISPERSRHLESLRGGCFGRFGMDPTRDPL
ncbi:hypothetical protein JXA40_08280 [bacterium]|nr:hypothetical protein [candidate division CSSED10-310 bacterium]